MDKGFPRPRIENNGKAYPLPYTAEENSIANLNDPRLLECINGGLCMICGESVGDRSFAMLRDGNFFSESGPFHEKCVKMTLFLCPHIKDNTRFAMAEVETSAILDFMKEAW